MSPITRVLAMAAFLCQLTSAEECKQNAHDETSLVQIKNELISGNDRSAGPPPEAMPWWMANIALGKEQTEEIKKATVDREDALDDVWKNRDTERSEAYTNQINAMNATHMAAIGVMPTEAPK